MAPSTAKVGVVEAASICNGRQARLLGYGHCCSCSFSSSLSSAFEGHLCQQQVVREQQAPVNNTGSSDHSSPAWPCQHSQACCCFLSLLSQQGKPKAVVPDSPGVAASRPNSPALRSARRGSSQPHTPSNKHAAAAPTASTHSGGEQQGAALTEFTAQLALLGGLTRERQPWDVSAVLERLEQQFLDLQKLYKGLKQELFIPLPHPSGVSAAISTQMAQ